MRCHITARNRACIYDLSKCLCTGKSAFFSRAPTTLGATLNWYFFAVANYFLYGETIIYYFKVRQKLLLLVPCSTFLVSMSSSRTLFSCHLQRTTGSSALCSTRLVCKLRLKLCFKAHAFSGFMGFVSSLKKNYLRRQFSLFGWVHMTLLVVILSSHFIVDNILEVRAHSVRSLFHFPHF